MERDKIPNSIKEKAIERLKELKIAGYDPKEYAENQYINGYGDGHREGYSSGYTDCFINMVEGDGISEVYLTLEYKQLERRIQTITKYINHYKPTIRPIELELLESQLKYMIDYRNVLELRGTLIGVDLKGGANDSNKR